MPWRAIDSDMDMTDARRDRERFGAEHRFDPKIDHPILDKDLAFGEWARKRRIDDDTCRRLFNRQRHDGGGAKYLSRGLPLSRRHWRGAGHGDCGNKQVLHVLSFSPFFSF
jgi:hypothetical protein